MKLSHKVAGAVGAGAVIAAMVPAAAFAAYACQAGEVCFYQNSNLTGTALVVKDGGSFRDLTKIRFTNGTIANDQISSVNNRTGHAVSAYTDIEFAGTQIVIQNGAFNL